jgi:hypothetical protein
LRSWSDSDLEQDDGARSVRHGNDLDFSFRSAATMNAATKVCDCTSDKDSWARWRVIAFISRVSVQSSEMRVARPCVMNKGQERHIVQLVVLEG